MTVISIFYVLHLKILYIAEIGTRVIENIIDTRSAISKLAFFPSIEVSLHLLGNIN